MKRMWILVFLLCLTGCGNSAVHGNLSNQCNKIEIANGLTEELNYQINFKANTISKVIYTKRYHASNEEAKESIAAIKLSLESENKYFTGNSGLTIQVATDTETEYSVVYTFELTNLSFADQDHFGLLTDRKEQIQKLKEQGFVCQS